MNPNGDPRRILAGAGGGDFINDTATHNPATGSPVTEWGSIYCVTACTFTTLTSLDITGATASIALAAGQTIYGRFTVIKLATGSVIAYYP
jgi:hypothetical protein